MGANIQMLADGDAEKLHRASLRIVSKVGMVLEEPGLCNLLRNKGHEVDGTTGVVRFPPETVEAALRAARRELTLASHGGDPLPLRPGACHPATYGNALNVLDYGASSPRSSTLADLERLVRLGDALDEVSIVCPACWPQDQPAALQDLLTVAATLSHSAKHTLAAPQTPVEAEIWYELSQIADRAAAAHPGPSLSFVVSSTSPLQLDGRTARVLRYAAERSIPLKLSPCPIAGATSPLTIAGTLVQANAENLWMLTLVQLLNEGAPVVLGGAAGPMDMRGGNLSYGCPERHLMLGANIELARFYGLPHNAPAGSVDAGSPDIQAGAEKMLTWMARLLNGVNLGIVFGSLLTGSTVSAEQMVIDADLWRSAQRVLRGFAVDEETMAVEAIRRVGPGGDFLMDDHTLRFMRRDEYYLSPLANRAGAEGQGMLERAHGRVEALLAEHQSPVDPAIVTQIDDYRRRRASQAAG